MFTMIDDRQDAPQWRVTVYQNGEAQLFQDFRSEPQADQYADQMRKLYAANDRARRENDPVLSTFVKKERLTQPTNRATT
jgi:hypothetical protein